MNENPIHTFQVLTKRSEILEEYAPYLNWTKNIWMGVTVENKDFVYRIEKLRSTNAFVKFLSLEPLIDELGELYLKDIDWVIVGGESGPGARPMKKEWVLKIKEQCQSQYTHFFFKQWGGTNKKKTGRLLEGRTWDEMPVREESFAS